MIFSVCSKAFALYGARPLKSGEHEAVLSLHLSDPQNPQYNYFCNAVLISPKTLLTAAHCIEVMGNEVYEATPWLTYHPEFVRVNVKGVKAQVSEITFAPSYFEVLGFGGEDLALITLKNPISTIAPLPIIKKSVLKIGQSLTLVSRQMSAPTKLIKKTQYQSSTVLVTDGSASGTCLGDSGGALLSNENGQWGLAGILTYQGEESCERKNTVSFFPRSQF